MKNKIIFSILLLTLCIASIQIGYAEPEFSLKFGSTGTGNDEFDNPTDILVSDNGRSIFVVDNNNHRISVFEDDGDYDFKFGSFCDTTSIDDCNEDADGADSVGDGQFDDPLVIAKDAAGRIFIIDADNDRVQVFDGTGEFKSKFGSSTRSADEYLGSATGIVIQESTRKVLVSNTDTDSISIFDSSGEYLSEFNSFDGNNRFNNPTNMIIDNSNQILYVSDSGNDRIVIFELVTGNTCPTGTQEAVDGVCFVEKFGSTGSDNGELNDPGGLAYDSIDDLLYVADSDNDRIQVFGIVDTDTCPDDTDEIVNGICFIEKFGTTGSGNGEFNKPLGIALDQTNDLLMVADSANDRIQVFSLNSGPIVLLPSRPDRLEVSPVSPNAIILSWSEPNLRDTIPIITGYKIEYKIGSGNYVTITENTASKTTSFIHQGLDPSQKYTYRVYSVNSEGTSTTSVTDSTKPEHTTTPIALTATAIASSQIRLSWLPPSETFGQSISGYDIKRELIPNVYDVVGSTNSGTKTFIVSDLEVDKTYTFAVSANIGYGSTGESPPASATPREDSVNLVDDPITSTAIQIAESSPPIKLTASVVSATQLNLSWSPPTKDGNTPVLGYTIEMKKDKGSYTTLVADTKNTETTYAHTSLDASSKYTYRVSAINVVGTSEPSNEYSATPKSTVVQLSPLGKLTIDEGKLLLFTVKLTDNSVKDVVFSLDKNPPKGAKIISNTGVFSWTPTSSDGGKTYSLDVVAKKDGSTDRETITITVNKITNNSQVVLEPEPTVTEPAQLGIASFVDSTKDPASYVDRYNTEPTYKKWFDETFPEYDSIYQAVGLKEPIGVASFVDSTKDPSSYVDRYNTEPTYKKWFDEAFPEYDSIYQAVGLKEPLLIPAPFVDPTSDLSSYVDRYNTEPTYKKWFDETFPEYDSIYQAVGISEPIPQEKKEGICGPGTKLIDTVCTIVDKSAAATTTAADTTAKPWWQFW